MTTKSKVGRLTIKLHRAIKTRDTIAEEQMDAFIEWRRLIQLHGDQCLVVEELERELEIERRVRDYIEGKP